jgi:hypothetical protein
MILPDGTLQSSLAKPTHLRNPGLHRMKIDNDSTAARPLDQAAKPPAGRDRRSDQADDPATAAAHGDGAEAKMAQLRELLFGSQMREYDQRFEDLAERQTSALARLRDEQRVRVEQLDAFVRGEVDRLSGELRLEREERLSAAHQLADQIETLRRDLAGDLGARIDALTAALADESRDRDAGLMAQARQLSNAFDARVRALEDLLQQERARLQDETPSRDELAQLFAELLCGSTVQMFRDSFRSLSLSLAGSITTTITTTRTAREAALQRPSRCVPRYHHSLQARPSLARQRPPRGRQRRRSHANHHRPMQALRRMPSSNCAGYCSATSARGSMRCNVASTTRPGASAISPRYCQTRCARVPRTSAW